MEATLTRDFEVSRYNALGPVEEANRTVRQDDLIVEFMRQAASLFRKHGVESRLGVALLHRHHTCEQGERMTQQAAWVDGERALVTRPITTKLDLREEIPWLWAVSDGQFFPMEFTRDPLARALLLSDNIPPEFLQEFAELSASSPIGLFIGLAVVERTLYSPIEYDEIPLEVTDPQARSAIVRIRKFNSVAKAIETAWTFKEYIDPVAGCDTRSSCQGTCRVNCICDHPGEPYPGKHSEIHSEHHTVRYEHS